MQGQSFLGLHTNTMWMYMLSPLLMHFLMGAIKDDLVSVCAQLASKYQHKEGG